MTASLQERFAPEPVPEWLLAFDAAPVEAVDALLARRFYLGRLNAADPEELLVDWTLLLADEDGFVNRLDEALAAWVERTWGNFPPEMSAARLADAWSRLANVVTYVEDLTLTARALRERFDEREDYLRPLSGGPSRDPIGRYLAAIAEHQHDQSLAPFWWQLCALPEGVPIYHSPYAIAGLLGLPPLEASQAGGFREHVAYGLLRLAEALQLRVEHQEVSQARAREQWLWTGRLALARLPFPSRWKEIFIETIRRGVSEECKNWLEALLPGVSKEVRRPGLRPERSETQKAFDIQSWPDRSKAIAVALQENRPDALERAETLLAEQERYALLHGESSYLGRSLRNFARSTWNRHPYKAAQWAEMARVWEPSEPISWSTLSRARWLAKGASAALPLAWEAVERFPEDAVARNNLADLLKKAGRLDEAERTYRQTVKDFPSDVFARTGLAEVLKEFGRLDEAEKTYREAVKDFPTNVVTLTGLAEVLKGCGRLDEAEQTYRQIVRDFPMDVYARNGLAEVLKESGHFDEAEKTYRETVKGFPTNVVARSGLAEVLKGSGRLDEAEQTYRQIVRDFPTDVYARNGLAEVLRESGRLDEAEQTYRQIVRDFSTDVYARNGLAKVLKESGRLGEAEGVYRQTMTDIPQDVIAPIGLAAVLRLRGSEHWQEAFDLVARVLEQGRNRAAALAEKARLLEASGLFAEAEEAFEGSRSSHLPGGAASAVPEQQPVAQKQPLVPPRSGDDLTSGKPEGQEALELSLAHERLPADLVWSELEGHQAPEAPKSPAEMKHGEAETTARAPGTRAEGLTEHRGRPGLSRGQEAALMGEARLLRRWARRGGDRGHGRSAEELRRKGEALLDKVLGSSHNNARALAEKGLLWLDDGRVDAAQELLRNALNRMPHAPTLLAAIARVGRERARAQSLSLSDETLANLRDAPGRLLVLSRGFEPLFHLQTGRAVLALQDGQLRRDLAAEELDRLHTWMRPRLISSGEEFASWWSRRLNEEVFAPIAVEATIGAEDIDALSGRMDVHSPEIDTLEEAFWLRTAHLA